MIQRSFRDYVDRRLVRRIRNMIEFETSVDIGCGDSLVGRSLGSTLAPWPYYDAQNLHQFADGQFDLALSLNVLEHLPMPQQALREMRRVARRLYLCWTPWYSPYGGHDFAPWHFFGRTRGRRIILGENLFKTTVEDVRNWLQDADWHVYGIAPRYWPWAWPVMFLATPYCDFMAWNVEILAA